MEYLWHHPSWSVHDGETASQVNCDASKIGDTRVAGEGKKMNETKTEERKGERKKEGQKEKKERTKEKKEKKERKERKEMERKEKKDSRLKPATIM